MIETNCDMNGNGAPAAHGRLTASHSVSDSARVLVRSTGLSQNWSFSWDHGMHREASRTHGEDLIENTRHRQTVLTRFVEVN
jgi:hypothetical protein